MESWSLTSSRPRILSHERVTPRGLRWASGEVRPAKQPWQLPVGASLQRPARSKSLSPVKRPKRLVQKSLTPQPPMRAGKLARPDAHGSLTSMRPLQEPGSTLITESRTFSRMYQIRKRLLIQAADPLGDCSWGLPYPKTYETLAEMLASANDWGSFSLLMTDFMFLWRKLQCNQMDLLHIFDDSKITLAENGSQSARLQAFHRLLSKNASILSNDPNSLFRLASLSRDGYVKSALRDLQTQSERFVKEWHGRLRILGSQQQQLHQQHHAVGEQPQMEIETQGLSAEDAETMLSSLRFQDALKKLHGMQLCGMVESLTPGAHHDLNDLVGTLAQHLAIARGRMEKRGLAAYSNIISSHLNSAQKFIELAALWTNSEDGCYENLTIYIPPKVWNDETARLRLHQTLCDQLAKAAKIDPQLVDVCEVALDDAQPEQSMQGKALVKLLAHASGLEVGVLSGAFWPICNGADTMQKGKVTVALRLVPLQKKKLRSKMAKTGQETFLSAQASRTQLVTKTRPGEINPVFQDESFRIFVRSPAQCLVVTAYSSANGIQSLVGEVYLSVDNLVSECQGLSGDEYIVRRFGLVQPVSLRPVYFKNHADKSKLRQSDIELSFRLYTLAATCSTQASVERIARQASDVASPLCAGCIVTGLAFQDEAATWEKVNLYLVSNPEEMSQEREFLLQYVLPALEIKAQSLKVLASFMCIGIRHARRRTQAYAYAHPFIDMLLQICIVYHCPAAWLCASHTTCQSLPSSTLLRLLPAAFPLHRHVGICEKRVERRCHQANPGFGELPCARLRWERAQLSIAVRTLPPRRKAWESSRLKRREEC
jgi:hypothetical protein